MPIQKLVQHIRFPLLSLKLSDTDGYSVSRFDGKFVAKICEARYNKSNRHFSDNPEETA